MLDIQIAVLTSSLQRCAMRNRAKSAEFGENVIQGEIMNIPSKRMKRYARKGPSQCRGSLYELLKRD